MDINQKSFTNLQTLINTVVRDMQNIAITLACINQELSHFEKVLPPAPEEKSK